MMKQIPLSAMTVVTLVASILVHKTMSTSVFQVQIPTELFRAEGYPHKEALFGIPNYGGTISERLMYGGDYVQPWLFCTEEEHLEFLQNKPQDGRAFILLIDRGNCSFVSKVRLAQHSGASGVVIADDKCVCSNPQCKDYDCEGIEPILGDDGSGNDVEIPSFLLEREDGKILKTHLQAQEVLKVEMLWSLPAPDDRVEWSLWTSAHDDTSLPFIDGFKDVISQLGKQQYFEPMYQLVDGSDYGCTNLGNRWCDGLCTNGGRYCMNEPDNTKHEGITGADIVKETLRQKCIWNEYGGRGSSDEGIGMKWWIYMSNFHRICYGTSQYTDEKCISSAMKYASIDKAVIDKCMEDSKGTENNVSNTIFDDELASMKSLSIITVPTLYVNNVSERGQLSTNSVLSAICSGYSSGTQPTVCNCAGLPSDSILYCIENDNQPFIPEEGSRGVSVGGVLIIIIVIISTMTAAGFTYWKRTQAQMHDQVRGILSEYILLDDQEREQNQMSFEIDQTGGSGGISHDEYIAPMLSQEKRALV
eukprot:122163_1